MRSAIFLAGALIEHGINPSADLPPLIFLFLVIMLVFFIAADIKDYNRKL